jgi:glycosyltransferase involved in cell wall biosynthesis
MRILHVIANLNPAHGGPPMICARLAAAQASLEHQVSIVYYDVAGAEAATAAALRDIPQFCRVTRHAMPPQSRWERLAARGARTTVQELMPNVDVLHLHSVWNPIMRVAAREARRAGKPYVILLNGMLHPWSLNERRLKKRVALVLGYRKMLDGAAALQLGNRDEERATAPLRLKPPGVIIPNGVFPSEIEPLPRRGTFRAKHPELKGEPYLLYLSRMHYKKGMDFLADAFVQLGRSTPGVRLVVAGPDDGDGTLPDFRRRIAVGGMDDRVHVVGPLYGPDKLAALVDADAFVLTSRTEGFSVAITEALGCGVPVVISEGCNFPEVAEVGAGEVVPTEPTAIAAAMRRVLSDPQMRTRMSSAGAELVRTRYTWPRIAKMTLGMYARAIRNQLTGGMAHSGTGQIG